MILIASLCPHYIDGFNYTDDPTAHGWTISSDKSPNINMLSGNYLEGGGGMRLLACTPVTVMEGELTDSKNMALSKVIQESEGEVGRISGEVHAGNEDGGHPLSGVSIELFRLDDGTTSNGYYSGYYYPYYMSSIPITDNQGSYTIEDIEPGVYALLAKDTLGTYSEQWYESIQHPVTDRYPKKENSSIPFQLTFQRLISTVSLVTNSSLCLKPVCPFVLLLILSRKRSNK